VSVENVVTYADDYLGSVHPAGGVIWDLSDMRFDQFSIQVIRGLSKLFNRITLPTAVLVSRGEAHLGRLIVEFAKIHRSGVQLHSFDDRTQADRWLEHTTAAQPV